MENFRFIGLGIKLGVESDSGAVGKVSIFPLLPYLWLCSISPRVIRECLLVSEAGTMQKDREGRLKGKDLFVGVFLTPSALSLACQKFFFKKI